MVQAPSLIMLPPRCCVFRWKAHMEHCELSVGSSSWLSQWILASRFLLAILSNHFDGVFLFIHLSWCVLWLWFTLYLTYSLIQKQKYHFRKSFSGPCKTVTFIFCLFFILFNFYVYECFTCMCVCASHAHLVSVEVRRDQEQHVLLTSELSLQPLCLFIDPVTFTLGLSF